QVLSMRSFLIPLDLAQELTKLQDKVPPVPFAEIKPFVEEELGRELDDCFQSFQEEPIAAASIAQAHPAVTEDGQEVIVKVQRPTARQMIATDMEILMEFAQLLEKYVPEIEQYDPVGIIQDLAKTTKRETDFLNEAKNIELFARNFREVETVYVPKVFRDLTTSRILTMERIKGIKPYQPEVLRQEGLDPRVVALNGGRLLFKQIFEDGFFHADPHPGNLFILPGNIIAPVDYGMMGRLDSQLMSIFTDALIAVTQKDVEEMVRVLTQLGITDEKANLISLRLDIAELIDSYYGLRLDQIDLRQAIERGSELARTYRVRIPSNLLLLGKALGTYEELGRTLDPEYDFISEARPYVKRLIRRRMSLGELSRQSFKLLRDIYRLLRILPGELELIVTRLRRGELSVQLQHRGLERLIAQINRTGNRLSLSLVIAALIVGSSLVMQLNRGPRLFDYPAVGIMGFVIAGIFGIWLIITIFRSRNL
ncbi:MAG: AarF/ABC1/UbiB kinase family protein, partial [Candidatus Latescibacteria bacterium]|nr:AarF/ABC1/UbiB kinase family protein [Candidatus Latescibacterota bacterium]